ncbi:MAG: PAS domain-containing protein [Candidatus Synoicihabitans palmerolidicus]|nr:PAS domain-containing protein [Candidatus Synoicihabitans palmerolidicus]
MLEQDDAFRSETVRLRDRFNVVHTVLLGGARAQLSGQDCAVLSEADVTEHIAIENALRENREFLATLVDQLPGMSFRCQIDKNRSMVWVNEHTHALCGYDPADFIERRVSFNSLILKADQATADEAWQQALRSFHGNRRYSHEYRIKHRDGRILWLWEQGQVVRHPSTHIDEIVGFATDIPARKLAERKLNDLNETLELRVTARTAELEAANSKLQDLDRLKTEFLATMSHELRTPLNSIIGFSSILERGMVGPLSDEQHYQIGLVNKSACQLADLINDRLDVSRIDSGRLEFTRETVDVLAVLKTVETELKEPIAQAKLRYETISHPDLPTPITDPRRLHQIVPIWPAMPSNLHPARKTWSRYRRAHIRTAGLLSKCVTRVSVSDPKTSPNFLNLPPSRRLRPSSL